MSEHDLLSFIDNEASKFALIKGWSHNQVGSLLSHYVRMLCASLSIRPWYGRVPTHSNIADAPSRFDYEFLRSKGFEEIVPVVPDAFRNMVCLTDA